MATLPPPWFSNGPKSIPVPEKLVQLDVVQVPVLPMPMSPVPPVLAGAGNFNSSK